ncbi:Nudix family hydrolase [Thiolapillus sp.]
MPNTAAEVAEIHVAAGVLKNPKGEILLARRSPDSHQGGLWEFPGGKIEPGETARQALLRELEEELGVGVEECRPLIRVSHCYADRKVVLNTWLVSRWRGEPQGKEGQPLSWVPSHELYRWPMPAADKPILNALRLPDTYLITPPGIENQERFLGQLEEALKSGISLLQFRVFGLEAGRLEQLAREACLLCSEHGARMMLNGSLALARKIGAHGLHLDRRRLLSLRSREEYADLLLSASCHNARELRWVEHLGVDFAVLSPVLPTMSHPDAEVLGWERFRELCAEISVPVYALGGMSADLLEQSWAQGAQGIAGIRGLWPVL